MPGQIAGFLERYKTWLETIDTAFDNARDLCPDAVPCHAGCSQCCYTLFAVPALDGYLLAYGLSQMDTAMAATLVNRCKNLFGAFKESVCPEARLPFRVEEITWSEFDTLVHTFQRPCPFLTREGCCGVYQWRPRICRLAGTVFRDPGTGLLLDDFCPMASEAREKSHWIPAPFNVSGMDGQMAEFKDEFRYLMAQEKGIDIPGGHTFPAAGLLEAL